MAVEPAGISGVSVSGPNAEVARGVTALDVDRDDAELARSAAGGDAAAFGVLYDRYYATVYRYAYLRARDRMETEDVTSETFERALRALPRYEPRSAFGAWLVRIARNVIVDRSRRARREAQRERLLAGDRVVDPEEAAVARAEARALRAALERLSELQRDVLILRYFVGFSTEEICAALDKGPSTVRGIHYRAIAALRRAMAGGRM